jgi:hypothetical protein
MPVATEIPIWLESRFRDTKFEIGTFARSSAPAAQE